MAGRWARLAVHAQMTGAVDYSRVSADNPILLTKEELLFREIERQLDYQVDVASMIALMIAPMRQEYLQNRAAKLLRNVQITMQPWLCGDLAAAPGAGLENVTANADFWTDYYHKIIDANRKRRARNKVEEQNAGSD